MDHSTRNPALEHLNPLIGEWESASTHPALPGTTVHGRCTFEWLEGGFFLLWRSRVDHSDFPDGLVVLGCADAPDGSPGECTAHSFDSRGYLRLFRWSAEPGVWRLHWESPAFSMRATATIGGDGDTLTFDVEVSTDGATWQKDLQATYRRVR